MSDAEPLEFAQFDAEDIRLVQERQHPVQQWGQTVMPDDVYCLPLPFMAAIESAKFYYAKGSGKYGKGYATGLWTVRPTDPWFWCHFVGDPVMPGSLGVDAIFQLAGGWSGSLQKIRGRARALDGKFTYRGQVFPTNHTIFYRIDIMRCLAKKGTVMFDGTLAVDDPTNVIYTLEDCKIGFFRHQDLGLPSGKAVDYYNPDWAEVRRQALAAIDRAEACHQRLKAERDVVPTAAGSD